MTDTPVAAAMLRVEAHRAVLSPHTIDITDVPAGAGLAPVEQGLPDWWRSNGNVLYGRANAPAPNIVSHAGLPPPRNARVVVGRDVVAPTILLWGEAPIVIIGDRVGLPNAIFACGGGSTIILGGGTQSTGSAEVNCRNGGLVFVGGDGLWAANVRIFSDDMHAIRAVSDGRRCNDFGGTVYIGKHVWLGFEALLLPGARVGQHAIVGARAVVTKSLPEHTVNVGVPARTVRSGVTWNPEDLP